jgi:DNA (cytosine-5)-methyltransferase 1
VVGAWAVGAPHRRERVWIVAHHNGGRRSRASRGCVLDGERQTSRDDVDGCGTTARMGDTVSGSVRHESRRGDGESGRVSTVGRDGSEASCLGHSASLRGDGDSAGFADSNASKQRRRQSSKREGTSRDALLGSPNSARSQGHGGRVGRPRELPAWSDGEASQGADGIWRLVKPGLPLLADGVPRRVERLRSTGNAVVPQLVAVIGQAIAEVDRG